MNAAVSVDGVLDVLALVDTEFEEDEEDEEEDELVVGVLGALVT